MQLRMLSCRFCEKVHHGEKKEMRRGPRDRTLISRVTSLMNGTRNPTGMMLYVCPLFSGDIKLTYQLANFISPIGKLPSSYVQVKLINSRYSRYQRDAYRDPNPYSTGSHATCRWRVNARRSTFRPCRSQEMGLVLDIIGPSPGPPSPWISASTTCIQMSLFQLPFLFCL